jgi:hypothetical protein
LEIKPETSSGYSQRATGLVERVLLEVWSRLGEYHDHLVLVGGLAPRYIIPQPETGAVSVPPRHCGTFDVDLAVSLAVAEIKTYESIRSTLVDRLGFEHGKSERGREQRHSFVKRVGNMPVILDFLTTKYDGPKNSRMRAVEEYLSAIQVEGLGLALKDPLQIIVEGELLEHGRHEAKINVCRPVPFVVLKALALSGRGMLKDAYDLVYVLRHYKDGPASVAAELRDDEREQKSFHRAVDILKKHFKNDRQDGPVKYQAFIPSEPNAALQAYAVVQEFLDALR